MKRLFAFVPAILAGLLLLNSFVLKAHEAAKVIKNKFGHVNTVLKSADGGQTWQAISKGLPEMEKPVIFFPEWADLSLHIKNALYPGKSIIKTPAWQKEHNVVELEGVLIATGQKGIRRSTDNGEHWQWVISEGGAGIAVEHINGGFAAITYNTTTKSRRIRVSLDNGKTWQSIDEGLPPSMFISSIKQTGKYLICGHPDGIFRSADMGKTWNRVHCGVSTSELKSATTRNSPANEPKNVFKLYVLGDAMYAVVVPAGC